MTTLLNLVELNASQLDQYRAAVIKAFPQVIGESDVIKTHWTYLEEYFPEFQFYLISEGGQVIGFMNTVPFYFEKPLDELPEEGWDWMFLQGVEGHRNGQPPNYLGGLQVIVRSEYQKLGYSQVILDSAKQFVRASKLIQIVIPIRPTLKHEYPKMPMQQYLELKLDGKLYDPWIRTHLNNGAKVIKVCERSMTIRGDVKLWENLFQRKLELSGDYQLDGALSKVRIDIESNFGEYIEPNIWIKYD